MEGLLVLMVLVIVGGLLILPIVAIVRTGRIRHLEARLARLEALLSQPAAMAPPLSPVQTPLPSSVPAPPPLPAQAPLLSAVPAPPLSPVPATERGPAPPPPPPPPPPMAAPLPAAPAVPSETIESIIGRRWVGLAAISLIVVAVAFFLKYAFENQYIGELGRVTLGVVAGLALVWVAYKRHGTGWRYLSDILTGGGVTILYLSVYGAFGYYHLVDARTAFIFLAILVAEAHLLAMAYRSRSIAVLALAGGFLVPMLLSTGRDQYRVLFTYIGILDLGMLGVVIARSWQWIGSLAYLGTQFLFWGWYTEHYHPEKRFAALLFQAAIFLIFAAADLAPNLRRRAAGWEEWIRLALNPFVFYATCYGLLDPDYHEWMAALALVLAAVYAALARGQLSLCPGDRRGLLVTLATALTFVTLAIPIQLDANWITIAWGVEALVLLWVGFETNAEALRALSWVVFSLALFRFLFFDIPWRYRAPFTPVLNRYFLGMLALTACLGGAAYLYGRTGVIWKTGLLAFGVFWLGSSIEAYTYFAALAANVPVADDMVEHARKLLWAGQLALSLLWSVYAGLLTAAGFRLQLRASRVAGLVLFGVTLVKALFVDIAELRQFYRIVALLILGLVLLGVAWKYQRSLRREQSS